METRVIGFHHVYLTDHGQDIAEEQYARCSKHGLRRKARAVSYGFAYPYDDHKLYEGQTLHELWRNCQNFDGLVYYIHTKGASHPPESRESQANFRYALEEVVIDQWQECIELLIKYPDIDCYGAYLTDDTRYFFPGNFWWARASHIRRLPNPVEWATQMCGRKGEDVRYGYEDWVTLSVPEVKARAKYRWRPDDPAESRTLW